MALASTPPHPCLDGQSRHTLEFAQVVAYEGQPERQRVGGYPEVIGADQLAGRGEMGP